jgi:hypothetical protein
MDKEELLREKKEKRAKYCWVDNRYNNRHIFLFSDSQKDALSELLEKDGSLMDECFQRVCDDDKNGVYSIDEIKKVYYSYCDTD